MSESQRKWISSVAKNNYHAVTRSGGAGLPRALACAVRFAYARSMQSRQRLRVRAWIRACMQYADSALQSENSYPEYAKSATAAQVYEYM